MSLVDLLILNLGARFTKLLTESWLGKGAGTTIAGDVVDLLKGRFQSVSDRKKAERELEELGDRMARELLPLFESAERQGHFNAEAVVLTLESALAGLTNSPYLIQKDLDPGAILADLRKTRSLTTTHFSQSETDLYERALERSVRHLVEVASRIPQFQEAYATRSLQQLSRVTGSIDEVLAGVRRLEVTVGAEALDKRAREYEIDYRLAVQRNLDYLEIFGIDLPPESRYQKLSVAYISLNLESSLGGASVSLPAETLFDRLRSDHSRLLIRGDAGTGKSTLLRWAAIQAAAGPTSSSGWPQANTPPPWRTRVPFLVRLRQCRTGSLPSPDEFPELIAQSLGGPPADWVRSTLRHGRALLLLDGVDEIPNVHRETARRGIADLAAQYPEAFFVVTTRPRAVDPNWLKILGFREARINPLSDLDRATFIDRWHEAVSVELRDRGKEATDLPETVDSLKRQLERNPEVARLATNPLLCAMICALHRDRLQKLPERQRQLCEDLCRALLHRRERESGLNLTDFPESYRRLDYPQKRAAVQELAHHMVLNEYSSVPTAEAQDQIGKALKQFPGHSATDATIVTESLVERSGILREESPGEISFIHNAFKELLAGDYFAVADSAGLLAKHALDPGWQPVILFAVAADVRGFATKVIRKILRTGWGNSTAELRARQLMALRCRAAALYIDDELDHQLRQLTAALFPPRTMEDAEGLATGGNTVVPFLSYRNELNEHETVASVRALRLIGTSYARQALRGFLGDRRRAVISELSRSVNPLLIEWVQERVLAQDRLPVEIAAQVSDLSPLANFPNLQSLDLTDTKVADLSPLAILDNLLILRLAGTPVVDLSPLAGLGYLQNLDLTGTRVVNLSPLAKLTTLRKLTLTRTGVADLSPLTELGSLNYLDLTGTQVVDLSPLAGLSSLEGLSLRGTPVADLSILAGLSNLRQLDARETRANNLEVLMHLDREILAD